MTFLQLLGHWHILQMGEIYFFQFWIYDIFAIAGTVAHIADGGDLFCSNFGSMTFLQLLGQWHILQMGVIFFQLWIYDIFAIAGTVAHTTDGSDLFFSILDL